MSGQEVTWIQVQRPTFDLVGVLVSSLSLTGILAGLALALGILWGLALIRRGRRPQVGRLGLSPVGQLGLDTSNLAAGDSGS